MHPKDPDRPALERDDARLVARVQDAWAPEPLTSARRAAFDAGLQERIERRQRRLGLWPALGAGLVAASIAALVLVREETAVAPTTTVVAAADARVGTATAWAADVLYASGQDDEEREADDDGLPDEYAAIAGVFLDR
jgi:hypothetical protein